MPNTIAENLQRLIDAKEDIADAIIAKSGTVGANDGLEEFAADIATIPSGGGEQKIPSNIRCKVTIKNEYSQLSIVSKAWNGLRRFYGYNIWTDGSNIYYSESTTQYVLDKDTSTWTTKAWNGLSKFHGNRIWSDGENIYYSLYVSGSSNQQYVLDKVTSTWTTKTWNGINTFDGYDIWTDGTNIYYSSGSTHYVFDTAQNKWISKAWNGGTTLTFNGASVFSDGKYIFKVSGTSSDVSILNGSYWYPVGLSLSAQNTGDCVWTDGTNIYYSSDNYQLEIYKKDIDTAPNTTPSLA